MTQSKIKTAGTDFFMTILWRKRPRSPSYLLTGSFAVMLHSQLHREETARIRLYFFEEEPSQNT